MPIVSSVPDAQVMSDLDATVAWAKSTGKADTKRLAITDSRWGGAHRSGSMPPTIQTSKPVCGLVWPAGWQSHRATAALSARYRRAS